MEFLTMVKFGDTYTKKYATSQENPSCTRVLIMNSNNSNMIKPDKTLKFDGAGIGYMDRHTGSSREFTVSHSLSLSRQKMCKRFLKPSLKLNEF